MMWRLLVLLLLFLAGQVSLAAEASKPLTNRLINSPDPYLQLHAHNPVDWYPWGPEALHKARRENKPIFVSIGYSTCYWCHVAEREIYSNPKIAELMNQWFVNIKVDREERPDLDSIYMLATQVMTGHGGWPNNVFLTPDLKPFFAGSYFPPVAQEGRPGFPQILSALHKAWQDDNDRVTSVAQRVFKALQQTSSPQPGAPGNLPDVGRWLTHAVQNSSDSFDALQGGFGAGTSKFPRVPQLSMLLAVSDQELQPKAQEMVAYTLAAMTLGGVMDQLAGGFHRYSTDPDWSVPHFEKMLYDNAQLLGLYARAFVATKKPLFRQVALRTAHYLEKEMQADFGGFYSAQDAEVNGVEGESYVWTHTQIDALLGLADSRRLFALYALTDMPEAPYGHKQPVGGVLRLQLDVARNLAANNQLAVLLDELAPLRKKLYAARLKRPQPARDKKIVSADNALAIIGFAQAGQLLNEPSLLDTATRTAEWLWRSAFKPGSGKLTHQFFNGKAGDQGFLDDYALLGQAFMVLLQATDDSVWLSRAQQLTDALLQQFSRPDGSLKASWDDTGLLIAPPSEGDSVKPSGNSAAITLLLQLSRSTHEVRYAIAARQVLQPLVRQVGLYPSNWGGLLTSLSEPQLQAVLAGAPTEKRFVAGSLLDSADHVRATGRWRSGANTSVLEITINVDDGYHINANPASEAGLVATQLLLDGHPQLKVDYPAPQSFVASFAPAGIAVYQGQVLLRATVAPPIASAARLKIQACDDQVCLAPATITITLGKSGK